MTTEIKVITATTEPPVVATVLNSDEFYTKLLAELHDKSVWRKLESLAEALKVDAKELRTWLDDKPGILRRKSSKEDTFLYCWEKRCAEKEKKPEKKSNKKPAVREEDRYAYAILHMAYFNFYRAMKTYSLEISQIDNDAFNHFSVALDKMETGLSILSTKSGASVEKLPKLF